MKLKHHTDTPPTNAETALTADQERSLRKLVREYPSLRPVLAQIHSVADFRERSDEIALHLVRCNLKDIRELEDHFKVWDRPLSPEMAAQKKAFEEAEQRLVQALLRD